MAKSKSKKDTRLNVVARSMSDMQETVDKHTRKERAKKHRRKKNKDRKKLKMKLIPKPKGRAGRKDGYSLVDEMQLSDSPELYNALLGAVRKLAGKYLDTSRTLTQQKDKLLVEKVIRMAQLENEALMRYEGGWPVRDMLGQYLRNRSATERKQAETLKEHSQSKKKRKVRDADDAQEPDSEAEMNARPTKKRKTEAIRDEMNAKRPRCDDSNKRKKTDKGRQKPDSDKTEGKLNSRTSTKKRKLDTASEPSDEREEDFKNSRKWQKSRRIVESDLESDNEGQQTWDDEWINAPKLQQGLEPGPSSKSRIQPRSPEHLADSSRVVSTGENLKQRKLEADGDHGGQISESAGPIEKLSTTTATVKQRSTNEPAPVDRFDDDPEGLVRFPHTSVCPGLYCTDEIPASANLSPELRTALVHYKIAYREKGRAPTLRLARALCSLVKTEHKRLQALTCASEKGWPVTSISFKDIPGRVIMMFEELKYLVFDRDTRENLHVWTSFEGDLEGDRWTIKTFARVPPDNVSEDYMTARYARPGYYGPKGRAIIKHTLLGLFPIESTSADAFKPLSYHHYFTFFVIPHIISCFLAEDFGTTITNGHSIMVSSSDVGEVLNPEVAGDTELEEIYNQTTLALARKSPGRPVGRDESGDDEVENAASILLQLKGRGKVSTEVTRVGLGTPSGSGVATTLEDKTNHQETHADNTAVDDAPQNADNSVTKKNIKRKKATNLKGSGATGDQASTTKSTTRTTRSKAQRKT